MDIFQRVQTLRGDAAASDEAVASARRALSAAITADGRPARTWLLRRPLLVIAGGAAAALVAGVLVVAVPRLFPSEAPVAVQTTQPPSPRPTSTVPASPAPTEAMTARTIFASLARRALMGDAPNVEAGQYLKIDSVTVELVRFDETGTGNDLLTGSEIRTASTMRHQETMYAPADLHGEWGWVQGEWTAVEHFGEGAQAIADRWIADLPQYPLDFRVAGGPSSTWRDSSGLPVADYFDTLPLDPNRLREVMIKPGDAPGDEIRAGWALMHALTFNVGSPTLRSAMYEALSELPGSELVSTDGNVATIVFRSGEERSQWVTIDLNSGVVSGYADRWTDRPSFVPSDVFDTQTVYSVTVVDRIP